MKKDLVKMGLVLGGLYLLGWWYFQKKSAELAEEQAAKRAILEADAGDAKISELMTTHGLSIPQ